MPVTYQRDVRRRQPRILTRAALCPLSRVSAAGHRQTDTGLGGREHEHALRLAHGTFSKSLMERSVSRTWLDIMLTHDMPSVSFMAHSKICLWIRLRIRSCLTFRFAHNTQIHSFNALKFTHDRLAMSLMTISNWFKQTFLHADQCA